MQPINFQYFLDQKYKQLQQQADAQTLNAQTNALTGAAAARLDNVQADVLPDTSAAEIARTRAQAQLFGQQAQVVVPESQARIRNLDADSSLTTLQGKALKRRSLDLRAPSESSLSVARSVLGGGGNSSPSTFKSFRLSDFLESGR